jgi:hypothetical protein
MSQAIINEAIQIGAARLVVTLEVEFKGIKYSGMSKIEGVCVKRAVETASRMAVAGGLGDAIKAATDRSLPSGCFVTHVLQNSQNHVRELDEQGLRDWVLEFSQLSGHSDSSQWADLVVAVDTEGRNNHICSQTWRDWLRPHAWRDWLHGQRRTLHAATYAQVAAAHGTAVFRLTAATWKIVLEVLATPGVITAMHDKKSDLEALYPLSTDRIIVHETQQDGQKLSEAYSRMHGGGPWSKDTYIGARQSPERRSFYKTFENTTGVLPQRHLSYAAADAIATRQLCLHQRNHPKPS